MSGPLPSLVLTTLSVPNYRRLASPVVFTPEALLDSSISDSGSTPTFRIRPGNVVVFKTAAGTFVSATDATGDRNKAPLVSSVGAGDATYNGATVTCTINGGPNIVGTLQAGTATNAAAASDLNSASLNPIFAANFVASVVSTKLQIQAANASGAEAYITAASSSATMFGSGVTLKAIGSDADYRVTEDFGDVKDTNNAGVNVSVKASNVGWFLLAGLINLTNEAQAVLTRKGSSFS